MTTASTDVQSSRSQKTKLDARDLVKDLFATFAINSENKDRRIIAKTHHGTNYGWLCLHESASEVEENKWVRFEIWPTEEAAIDHTGFPLLEIVTRFRTPFISALSRVWCIDYRIMNDCNVTVLWFAEYMLSILNRLCELVRTGQYNTIALLGPDDEIPMES